MTARSRNGNQFQSSLAHPWTNTPRTPVVVTTATVIASQRRGNPTIVCLPTTTSVDSTPHASQGESRGGSPLTGASPTYRGRNTPQGGRVGNSKIASPEAEAEVSADASAQVGRHFGLNHPISRTLAKRRGRNDRETGLEVMCHQCN